MDPKTFMWIVAIALIHTCTQIKRWSLLSTFELIIPCIIKIQTEFSYTLAPSFRCVGERKGKVVSERGLAWKLFK